MMIEVFGRLISPMSENATCEWVKRTALGDIILRDISEIKRDSLYRISDKLIRHKERIEELLAEKEEELFKLEERIYLYDLTSSYFEGRAVKCKKARYGYSRDGRSDCKQIIVGLILDRDGFVKGHEVYEGNKQDVSTLKEVIEKLTRRRRERGGMVTVIVDRGVASQENLSAIKERGMYYIVAARKGERDKYFEEFEGVEMKEVETKSKGRVRIAVKEIGGEVYILCESEGRKEKERSIREGFYKKMELALLSLKRGIESGRIKERKKIEEKVGRIKERYKRVSRYYEIEGKEVNGVYYLSWRRKGEEEDGRYDGSYLLRTNRKDLTGEEVWKIYIMLTRVERAFRDLKSGLGIRPIYHQKDIRVEGHIFISVLAYHLLHAIEYRLRLKGDGRSWNTIKQILQTHQVVSVVLPDVDGEHVHHIRVATEPEGEQKKIYESLGVNPKPIKRQRLTIKKDL